MMYDGPDFDDEMDIRGKIVIITGCNTGIGYQTAIEIAKRGAHITMACRSRDKALEAASKIKELSGNKDIFVEELDLSDLKSIRDFALNFTQKSPRLDILINNAGVFMNDRKVTKDGFEMHFGTNYLGHFYLTHLLLDLLKKSAPSRIVNVSSKLHQKGKIHWDDLNLEKCSFGPFTGYGQSKLAIILFTTQLAKHLEGSGVTAVTLCPGIIKSDGDRYFTGPFGVALRLFRMIAAKSKEEGSVLPVFCSVSAGVAENSGRYYSSPGKPDKLDKKQVNEEDALRLWELSFELVGIRN